MQILELTSCSHVELFVDSHPKFTCQTQKISVSCRLHGAEVLKICGPMKQTQEELMHAWQESQKQGGEIGISGSRVDGIRSLPPAHTHQKLEVISLSELRYEKEDSHIKYIK